MLIIRKATLEDVDELVKLRMELLREISEVNEHYTAKLNDDYIAKLADAIREYFTDKIPENEFLAWVAEDKGKIIASSGLVFHEKPPIHGNLTGREAYIMNMYTVPAWRNKGLATNLLKEIIKFIKETNVQRIRLHATEAGKKIYEKMGFISDSSEMILDT